MAPVPSTSTYKKEFPITYRERPIRRSARACVACRRAKARCDGPELCPCRRCRESGVECIFEGGTGTTSSSPSGSVDSPHPTNGRDREPSSSYSLERRLQYIESQLYVIRQKTDQHAIQLEIQHEQHERDEHPSANYPAALPGSPYSNFERHDSEEEISMEDPVIDELARRAFDTSVAPSTQSCSPPDPPPFVRFWNKCAPWAPYISPATDTYDQLQTRSPLLLYCILAVTSRFHENANFARFAETQALSYMRATLYAPDPPSLDDLKGTVLWNAWLCKGAPPGHSLSLALQMEIPKKLEKLLAALIEPVNIASLIFEELMPSVRVWLSLYAQDLWLSVATGRRSMVTLDFSISSARSLLKFPALRPVDARIIAQCELVTILGRVQDAFLKTKSHSVAETVDIIRRADGALDEWMKTWADWAHLQQGSTESYMTSSFAMQLHVGRFYINTLGLRDITTHEDITEEQLPVIHASIEAAIEVQNVAVKYGGERLRHATEFTLISISSSALFLLKMIKLLPGTIDVNATLSAVRRSSNLLADAPCKQYARAVELARGHLEAQLSPNTLNLVSPAPVLCPEPNTDGGDPDLFFDPEMELAISSVLHQPEFWSWEQSAPSEAFSGILS